MSPLVYPTSPPPVILLAAAKPFAKEAVTAVSQACDELGFKLKQLQGYKSTDELYAALPGCIGCIVRSDKVNTDFFDHAP
ncbi:hypothetical protein Pmar_PMAR021250, partial [Perkinsus marinus ATCC 50983]